ncbi:MAG TPA: hypothetical protein VHW71_03825 [Steroidobacteraceae bacterium]|jgi:hypothetical protein|nr:hypothetical protein [Steroidobacteraceae bacterium]
MTAPEPEPKTTSFHRRYLDMVEEIESEYSVASWKGGDVDVWPLARMELYLDMHWASTCRNRPTSRAFPFRPLVRLAKPVTNWWNSRRDLAHFLTRPRRAGAIFLGDGVSLDFVDGQWQDRFCEPLIASYEAQGVTTFLMQSGNFNRLPWRRPTYAANLVAAKGLRSLAQRLPLQLPDYEQVLGILERYDVRSPSLVRPNLAHLASTVSSTASEFELVFRRVKPSVAFVVTYYAGLGPAFVLACRRQGILSVDLQHCPQEGAHKAYCWTAVPAQGYTTMPAVFWTWSEREASDLRTWTSALAQPWHRSLYGGHVQVMPFLIDGDPATVAWDRKFADTSNGVRYEREILVALQPIAGHRARWEALAQQINSSPDDWRWWLRRHPASGQQQDSEYSSLLSIRRSNVLIEEASSFPLPALLRNMSVLVSLASGACAEAAAFGVPALFLSDEARDTFSRLIERNVAAVIDVAQLNREIGSRPARTCRSAGSPRSGIEGVLRDLGELGADYSRLCGIFPDRQLRA